VLSPEETARLAEVPTENTRAYDFYLSGRDYFTRINDNEFMPLAVQQFERAVAEDPAFAVAWAALARAHTVMYLYALDRTPERLRSARAAVDEALALAPEAGETHLALAYYYYLGERDYSSALAELARAEEVMPGNSEVFETRAYVVRRDGDFDRAVANMERAIELDPRNIDVIYRQTGNYLILRDYAQVERYLERILDIAPDNGPALFRKASVAALRDADLSQLKTLVASGRLPVAVAARAGWQTAVYERDYETALRYLDGWEFDVDNGQMEYIPRESYYGVTHRLAGNEALAVEQFEAARMRLEDALRTMPDDARIYVSLGEALAGLGDAGNAARAARRALELLPTTADGMIGPGIQADAVTRVFAPLGDVETVVAELDSYLSRPGWLNVTALVADPRFDGVRDDPRFRALVERYAR